MTNWGILSHWKRIIFLITILVICLGFSGANEIAKGFTFFPDRGLNPIPVSPPPNKIYGQMRTATDPTYEGYLQVQSDSATRYVSSNTEVPARSLESAINEFGKVKSLLIINNNIVSNLSTFQISSNPTTNTVALLMYPQVRDIIKRNATITSAKLITEYFIASNLQVGVKEITQSWDPRINITTLPQTGAQISSNVWNLSTTPLAQRYLDVTTVVNNWFNNTNAQWGFMMYAITQGGQLNLPHPPRLYIEYTMPNGSYSSITYGATWYDDQICPGMWIPQRATFINKTGILNNNVTTTVYAGFELDPPFGYDNQSARWVVNGDPANECCVPAAIDMSTTSQNTYNDMKNVVPSHKIKPFNDGQNKPAPPTSTYISDPCCILPEEQEDACYRNLGQDGANATLGISADAPYAGPQDLNGDCIPDDETLEDAAARYNACLNRQMPINSLPPPIKPPKPPQPPNPPTPGGGTTYTWTPMPQQLVAFSSNMSTNLTKIDTSQSGWFNKWKQVGSTIRIAPEGNLNSAFGNQPADDCCDHITDPRHNKWRFAKMSASVVVECPQNGSLDGG